MDLVAGVVLYIGAEQYTEYAELVEADMLLDQAMEAPTGRLAETVEGAEAGAVTVVDGSVDMLVDDMLAV